MVFVIDGEWEHLSDRSQTLSETRLDWKIYPKKYRVTLKVRNFYCTFSFILNSLELKRYFCVQSLDGSIKYNVGSFQANLGFRASYNHLWVEMGTFGFFSFRSFIVYEWSNSFFVNFSIKIWFRSFLKLLFIFHPFRSFS